MQQTRVNILTAVNAASVSIAKKQIDGEQYSVIQNVKWHVDDIVLNGGLYPSDENKKAFNSMEGRLMPFGHPKSNGQYVAISNLDSASATRALGKHYGGVHAENVRNHGGEYFADVMINERVAAAHADGQKLLGWTEAVANGETPESVHMSTGLLTNRVQRKGRSRGKDYSWVATNQQYDHLAILFNEQGAGGDEIALAVNCDEVINSVLEVNDIDPLEQEAEQLLDEVAPQAEEKLGLIARMVNYLRINKPTVTVEEIDDMTPEELQVALNAQAEKLQATFNDALAAQKADFDKVLADVTAQVNAKVDAEAAAKREVVAKELGDVVANALSGEALDAAFAKCHKSAGLGVNKDEPKDEFEGYRLNQAEGQ